MVETQNTNLDLKSVTKPRPIIIGEGSKVNTEHTKFLAAITADQTAGKLHHGT